MKVIANDGEYWDLSSNRMAELYSITKAASQNKSENLWWKWKKMCIKQISCWISIDIYCFNEYKNNKLIDGVSIFIAMVSLYCDNKSDNFLRMNSRSVKFENVNVPAYD